MILIIVFLAGFYLGIIFLSLLVASRRNDIDQSLIRLVRKPCAIYHDFREMKSRSTENIL